MRRQSVVLRGAARYEPRGYVNPVPKASVVVQSEKDNTDINVIVRRFGVTGQVPVSLRTPEYGDFSGVFDFQTAMNVVREAQENFAELPAALRRRFHDNPQEFLEFVNNKDNLDEARKLGITKPVVTPEPEKVQKVEVVNVEAKSKE